MPCVLKLFDALQQAGGKLIWKEIYAFDDPTSRLIKNAGSSIANYTKSSPSTPKNSFSPSSSSVGNDEFHRHNHAAKASYVLYHQLHVKFQLFMRLEL